MRAVIYTRVSTNEQTSHDDQVRVCQRIVEREGWEVVRVYTDHAISGARSLRRPEYQRMLPAAKAGEFEVLLVDALSRFARDMIEQEREIRRLEFKSLIIVSADYDSRAHGRRLMRGMRGLINQEYLDVIRRETHRGLEGRALGGLSTDGRAYGYCRGDAVVGRDGAAKGYRLAIDDKEADVVRRIFREYAKGRSARAIANALNADKIPSPGARWKRTTRRRDAKWLASAIAGDPTRASGILNNSLYRGVRVWNRSRRAVDPETEKDVFLVRPAGERVTVEVPHLRIITDELWERVKARQRGQAERIGVRVKRGLSKKAADRTGRAPKYLLTGILRCGTCDANAVISGTPPRYTCASRTNAGEHACSNGLRVAKSLVEERVLAELRADLADPAAFREFERAARDRRVAELEREVANLTDAIARGGLSSSPALGARLTAAETELRSLVDLPAREERMMAKIADVLPKALDRYRRLVADLDAALRRDVDRARAELRGFFDGGIVRLVPNGDHLDAEYRLDGRALVKSLLGSVGNQADISVVAEAGFWFRTPLNSLTWRCVSFPRNLQPKRLSVSANEPCRDQGRPRIHASMAPMLQPSVEGRRGAYHTILKDGLSPLRRCFTRRRSPGDPR